MRRYCIIVRVMVFFYVTEVHCHSMSAVILYSKSNWHIAASASVRGGVYSLFSFWCILYFMHFSSSCISSLVKCICDWYDSGVLNVVGVRGICSGVLRCFQYLFCFLMFSLFLVGVLNLFEVHYVTTMFSICLQCVCLVYVGLHLYCFSDVIILINFFFFLLCLFFRCWIVSTLYFYFCIYWDCFLSVLFKFIFAF